MIRDAGGAQESRPVPLTAWDVLADSLHRLKPITLDELNGHALLDRIDTKFLVAAADVPALLDGCARDYRALEVMGRRVQRYHTRYFDTPELHFYYAHYHRRLPRRKVRVRSYLETRERFLEVKRKLASGRTTKSRLLLRDGAEPEQLAAVLESAEFAGMAGDLREIVSIEQSRIALASRLGAERVTFDVGLCFANDGRTVVFPGVAIIEVKQPRRGRTAFLDTLRAAETRALRLSKYCLAVAALCAPDRAYRYRRVLERMTTLLLDEQLGADHR